MKKLFKALALISLLILGGCYVGGWDGGHRGGGWGYHHHR